jgi:hypothetical protein
MSSICLTCEDKPNTKENCIYTAQGNLQCYNDGKSPESEILAAERVKRTAFPGTTPSQVYPVRGIDDEGYYKYISELSGQVIQNRYIQTAPVSQTNACAVNVVNSPPLNHSPSGAAKGRPEWGPHVGWLSAKDAAILDDPVYSKSQ